MVSSKNLISIFTGWLIPTVVFFFFTPFLIKNIGVEAFGIFTLINVFSGYVSFLNFGFGQAVTKHISSYNAQKLLEKVNDSLIISIFFFTIIGVVGFLFIYFFSDYAVNKLFNITDVLKETAILSFKIGSFGFLLNMFNEVLRGLSIGLENFIIPNLFRNFRVLLSSLFMVIIIIKKGELHEILIGNILGQLLSLFFYSYFVLKFFSPIKFRINVKIFKDMLNYSKFVFGAKSLTYVASELGVIILGIFNNTGDITFFDIPRKLVSRGMEIFNRFFEIIFPVSSVLNSRDKKSELNSLYIKVFKFQLIILSPILILSFFHGKWLLNYWLSGDFVEKSFIVLLISTVTSIISTSSNLPSYYSMGIGRPEFTTKFTLYRFLIIAITIIPLIKLYGYIGLAIALLLGEFQAIYFIFYLPKKLLNLNIFSEVRMELLKYLLIFVLFGLLYSVSYKWIFSQSEILIQFLISLILLSIYFIFIYLFKIISLNSIKRGFSIVKK